MISHAHLPFTLPCLRPCLPPVPNLWLLLLLFQIAWVFGFIMATRGATMMIVEIDSPTFPLITFIICGKSWKMKVSRVRWKNRENVQASVSERHLSKFSALHEKIPHMYRKCSIALFVVASMSAWSIQVSLPPYRIPHQCHQCSNVNSKCHNRPIRGYTGIQYTGTTLC